MATATLNIKLSPRRMLSEREAAEYCGIVPVKRFRAICPVAPISLLEGNERFDMHDLDFWIDELKLRASDSDADILARLK